MQSQTPDIQSIAARVEKLEKQNRRIKTLCLFLVFLPTLAIVACQSRSADVVEAQRIALRDKSGKTRIEITMSYDASPNGNPVIRLLDENGKDRTVIGAGVLSVSGGKQTQLALLDDSLQFYSESGVATARLDGKNGGNLYLIGKDGTVFLRGDSPLVEVSDNSGFLSELGNTTLTVTASGETRQRSAASLVLVGKGGKVLWSAPR